MTDPFYISDTRITPITSEIDWSKLRESAQNRLLYAAALDRLEGRTPHSLGSDERDAAADLLVSYLEADAGELTEQELPEP